MIVLVVQYVRIAVPELKSQPPISADPNRPAVPGSPFERMQTVTRHVHIFDHPRRIQGRQLQTKSSSVFGLNTGLAASLVVALQAFVLERLNHQRKYSALRITQQSTNLCFCVRFELGVLKRPSQASSPRVWQENRFGSPYGRSSPLRGARQAGVQNADAFCCTRSPS